MSSAKFVLTVDPDEMLTGADQLEQAGRGFAEQGQKLTRLPADVPRTAWEGQAHTAVMAEVSALAGQVRTFEDRFARAASRIRQVASEARDALAQVKGMNGAWTDSELTFQQHQKVFTDAAPAAATDLTGVTEMNRQQKWGAAQKSCSDDQAGLNKRFSQLVEDLDQQFIRLSQDLAGLVVIPVSPAQAAAMSRTSDCLQPNLLSQPGWLDVSALRSKLPLSQDLVEYRLAVADAKAWKSYTTGNSTDPPDAALIKSLLANSNDPMYAHTLLTALGPKAVAAIPDRLLHTYQYETGPTIEDWLNVTRIRPGGAAQLAAMRTRNRDILAGFGQMLAVTTTSPKDSATALDPAWLNGFLATAGKEAFGPLADIIGAANQKFPGIIFGGDFLTTSLNAAIDGAQRKPTPEELSRSYSDPSLNPDFRAILRMREATGSYFSNLPQDTGVAASNHALDPFSPLLTALAVDPGVATQWFADGVPERAGEKGPFVSPHVAWMLANDGAFASDNGASLGAAFQAGLTANGAGTKAAATAMMGVVHQLGSGQGIRADSPRIELPDGAKAGMRVALLRWVDALNWNTSSDAAVHVVDGNPGAVSSKDAYQPTFTTQDANWVMQQAFTGDNQLAPYTQVALSHLHADFLAAGAKYRDGQGNIHAGDDLSLGQWQAAARNLGFWQGELTWVHSKMALNSAEKSVSKMDRDRAWLLLGLNTIQSLPVVDNLTNSFVNAVGATQTVQSLVQTGISRGTDAATNALVNAAYPDKGWMDKAENQSMYKINTARPDGEALMTNWLLELNMLDDKSLDDPKTHQKYTFLERNKSGGGYTVNIKNTDDLNKWSDFVGRVGNYRADELNILDGYETAFNANADGAAGNLPESGGH